MPMLLVLAFGCERASAARFDTEDLRVFAVRGEELCRGNADLLQREYERLRGIHPPDALAITPKLDVVVGESATDVYCDFGEAVGGCAGVDDDNRVVVAGSWITISHEMVHGVRLQHELYGNRFFEEGLAEYHRAGWIENYAIGAPQGAPTDLVADFGGDLGAYITAGSFMAYVSSEFGSEPVLSAASSQTYRAADSSEAVQAWYQGAFGETIQATEMIWSEEAQVQVDRAGPCGVMRSPLDGEKTYSDEVACEDNGVGPIGDGMLDMSAAATCLEISTQGVEVSNSSDPGVELIVIGWSCSGSGPAIANFERLQTDAATTVRDVCWLEVTPMGPISGFRFEWTARPMS